MPCLTRCWKPLSARPRPEASETGKLSFRSSTKSFASAQARPAIGHCDRDTTSAIAGLLVTQGVDGIESGGLVGGIKTEEDPDERRKAKRDEHAVAGDDGGPARKVAGDLGPSHAYHHADQTPECADYDGLHNELQADMPALGAHRHANADFPCPLRHRHEQNVHDPDPSHEQRDGRHGKEHECHGFAGSLLKLDRVELVAHREVIVLVAANLVALP